MIKKDEKVDRTVLKFRNSPRLELVLKDDKNAWGKKEIEKLDLKIEFNRTDQTIWPDTL